MIIFNIALFIICNIFRKHIHHGKIEVIVLNT